MPLADFVFALNGDVERYALSYEMATSPSRMYANSKIKSDGKYRNENDPNNLFTASRAQKILSYRGSFGAELTRIAALYLGRLPFLDFLHPHRLIVCESSLTSLQSPSKSSPVSQRTLLTSMM
jgi:hypothetical protein